MNLNSYVVTVHWTALEFETTMTSFMWRKSFTVSHITGETQDRPFFQSFTTESIMNGPLRNILSNFLSQDKSFWGQNFSEWAWKLVRHILSRDNHDIKSAEKTHHKMTVYNNQPIFRGYPATEQWMKEIPPKIDQMWTKISIETRFNNQRSMIAERLKRQPNLNLTVASA
jgi:hypothetical protein